MTTPPRRPRASDLPAGYAVASPFTDPTAALRAEIEEGQRIARTSAPKADAPTPRPTARALLASARACQVAAKRSLYLAGLKHSRLNPCPLSIVTVGAKVSGGDGLEHGVAVTFARSTSRLAADGDDRTGRLEWRGSGGAPVYLTDAERDAVLAAAERLVLRFRPDGSGDVLDTAVPSVRVDAATDRPLVDYIALTPTTPDDALHEAARDVGGGE